MPLRAQRRATRKPVFALAHHEPARNDRYYTARKTVSHRVTSKPTVSRKTMELLAQALRNVTATQEPCDEMRHLKAPES
jgi:hypothetical protein